MTLSKVKIIQTIEEMQQQSAAWRQQQLRIAFVPTMGNLHDGHCHLLEQACQLADKVVLSIFVNPLQFAPNEDFATYPRTVEADLERIQHYDLGAVFLPSSEMLYPTPQELTTTVYVPELSKQLCGISRPHFFQGVTTIVCKLFNIVTPHIAVFGKKDYQQLAIIRRMTQELNFPINIIGAEIQRETSGLALSSRNQYLTKEEKQQALGLTQTLSHIAEKIKKGHSNYLELEQDGLLALKEIGFSPDYVAIRQQSDLQPPQHSATKLVVLGAATIGKARLIDNIELTLD